MVKNFCKLIQLPKIVNIKFFKFISFLFLFFAYNCISISMEKIPYHHLPDGTFRNPEGSPKRDTNFKWSFKIFNQEKKKLNMSVPKDHVINKEKVLYRFKKIQRS